MVPVQQSTQGGGFIMLSAARCSLRQIEAVTVWVLCRWKGLDRIDILAAQAAATLHMERDTLS